MIVFFVSLLHVLGVQSESISWFVLVGLCDAFASALFSPRQVLGACLTSPAMFQLRKAFMPELAKAWEDAGGFHLVT